MSVIEEIYKGSEKLSEKNMLKDRDYERSKNQAEQCYNRLCEELSDKNMAIVDKLVLKHNTQAERKYVQCFKAGFRTGLAAAFEALK